MITPYSNIISVTTLEALLLDTYSGAAAAYSLRKLRSGYTGSAIRVRRADNNTEQDIGFVSNELDTATLASFCSGTDGFVVTWYDQSGSGVNATQTTAANQPKIYDSSTGVITENGKAAVQFDGSNDSFNLSSSIPTNALMYQFWTLSRPTASILSASFGHSTNSSPYLDFINTDNNVYYRPGVNGAVTFLLVTVTGQILLNSNFKNSTAEIYYNGGSLGSQSYTGATVDLQVFGRRSSIYHNGNIQEIVLYTSDQSTNRTGIETNINTFYSIY